MLVCAIDFETTGLDTAKDSIIEIGAIVYDSTTYKVVESMGVICRPPNNVTLEPIILKITGITQEQVDTADSLHNGLTQLNHLMGMSQVCIAHNKTFDEQMYLSNCKALALEPVVKPWICSKDEIPSHYEKPCKKLSHLALDYGLAVDGSKLHRALNDVELMIAMLQKTELDMSYILEWNNTPWVFIEATNVGKPWVDGGKGVADAKAEGFRWNGDAKKWLKKIKENEYESEKSRESKFKRVRYLGA